jgi:hypothetical protein
MARKLEEFPNFLVSNSWTKSFGTVPFSLFSYCCLLYTDFCIYISEMIIVGFSNIFLAVFSDEHERLPHVAIPKDGRLCSTVQHRPGFSRVLYDALLHLGYNGDVPVYHDCMSMAHGLD